MVNRKNFKILSSLFVSTVIASISLLLILNSYPSTTFQEIKTNNFFEKEFDVDEHNIFIFGASQTGRINSTLVDEEISKIYDNYSVYNLSYDGDMPKTRYKLLPQILSLEPSIIFYGVSYRDFTNIESEQSSNLSLLKYLDTITDNKYEFDSLNPKLATLKAIKDLTFEESLSSENRIVLSNSPLMTLSTPATKIASKADLEKSIVELPIQIEVIDNEQVNFLKRSIEEIKKHDIKIIIFTTPLSKYHLQGITDSDKQSLDLIINEISNEFNVPVYNFTSNFATLDIWSDNSHVAFNKNSAIYSENIAKMILKEIES